MSNDPKFPQRRSIRMAGYDYGQTGWYFITVCTDARARLFGEIVDAAMQPNASGTVVNTCWLALAEKNSFIELDAYVLMPNHVHGILHLTQSTKPLGRIVGAFKTMSTARINSLRNTPGEPVWQRNFYEHVIRNEKSLSRIREYIHNNPIRWDSDPENH